MKNPIESRRPRRLLLFSLTTTLSFTSFLAANAEPFSETPTAGRPLPIFTNIYPSLKPGVTNEIAVTCYEPLTRTLARVGSTLITLAIDRGTTFSGIENWKDPETAALANDYGNALAGINGIPAEDQSASDPIYIIQPNHYYYMPAKCNLSLVPER